MAGTLGITTLALAGTSTALQPMRASPATPVAREFDFSLRALSVDLVATAQSVPSRAPLRRLRSTGRSAPKESLTVIPFSPTGELGPAAQATRADAADQKALADYRRASGPRSQQPLATLDEPLAKRQAPAVSTSFDGTSNADNFSVYGGRVVPPDPVGDVGPNHYVQMVNILVQIFDKQGTSLAGPTPLGRLWPAGSFCRLNHFGDPIVLYDHLANRWFLSELAFRIDRDGAPGGPFHQCIAVSQSPDPTGNYFLYDFVISETKVNDYPKFGVWPDGYYATWNHLDSAQDFAFSGVGVGVFERDAMLVGAPARLLYAEIPATAGVHSMLPSDLDGPASSAGTPNFFVQLNDDDLFDFADELMVLPVTVDWSIPGGTVGPPAFLPVEPFDGFLPFLCGVLQPGVGELLDPISDRLLHRASFRDLGAHQTLVLTHSIAAETSFCGVGKRWYEVRFPGGTPTLAQQGTTSPNYEERWMGSAAMDRDGNIALGYSVSGASTFPSIRYTGRLAGDPAGLMPQSEAEVISGSGAQLGGVGRWGDYSAMVVDPVDGCTFWYTQEYYAATGVDWRTRIASFSFPSCGADPAGSLEGTVTDVQSGEPIPFADVVVGAHSTVTDGTGGYVFERLPTGNHTLRVSSFGHDAETVDDVTVASGTQAQQDVDLVARGLWEDFDASSPRTEVTVIDNAGTGAVWRFDNPGRRVNRTGADGSFAIVDSDFAGITPIDTELRLAPLDLSEFTRVILEFDSDFNHFSAESADVDVSIDGGSTWSNVWRRQGSDFLGPSHEVVDLSELASGQADVGVRFHYYNALFDWWWQVDNVLVTASGAPIVTTGQATNVSQNGAVVTGTVNPRGEETTYHFEWGTTTDYAARTREQSAGSDHQAKEVTARLSGLAPGTTFHFRIVAANAGGTSTGEDQAFTTGLPPAPPPPARPEAPGVPEEGEVGPGDVRGARVVLLVGTRRADVLRGTSAAEIIRALGGSDVVRAGRGDDTVYGGSGHDLIFGGAGNDLLIGGRGRDQVRAKRGDDRVKVRDGWRDRVSCGPGADLVFADERDLVSDDCEVVRRR